MTSLEVPNAAINKANSSTGLLMNYLSDVFEKGAMQEILFCLSPFELGWIHIRLANAECYE